MRTPLTRLLPALYILIWLAVNLLFLTDFPFVHTDEAWLSGLSRSMEEAGTLAATEDFFDLLPRQPHALKILYHLLQILFIRLLGYSLATVRLLSLLAGAASLALFHRLALRIAEKAPLEEAPQAALQAPGRPGSWAALAAVLTLSADIQFIYTAHLARQEIFMVLLSLAVFNLLVSRLSPLRRGGTAGLILGLSLGFHPNGFLLAWPPGLFLLAEILRRRRPLREGAAFLAAAGLTAILFTGLSLAFNPRFFMDYAAYGAPLGVLDAPDVKFLRWPRFYGKLFNRISGTYYTPPIQISLIAFPLLLMMAAAQRLRHIKWRHINFFRDSHGPKSPPSGLLIALCGAAGFNIGLVLLGKYSQPSVILLFPYIHILGADILVQGELSPPWRRLSAVLMGLLAAGLLTVSVVTIAGELRPPRENLARHTAVLDEVIPPGSAALGGLYCEYAMADGELYEWRNLPFLKEAGLSLDQYLADREIEYIILPEELEFIYQNRPYWNVIYGNPAHWYPQLQEILKERGTLLREWESPLYAMRITAYRSRRPWKMSIYRLSTRE